MRQRQFQFQNPLKKARPNSLSNFLNKIPKKPDIVFDENLLDNDEDVTDTNLEIVEKEVKVVSLSHLTLANLYPQCCTHL